MRAVDVARSGNHLLRNVDLSVETGSLTSIIGPNGAGKSSLLRVLSGELAPDAGVVALDSSPMASYSAEKLAGRRAVLPQHSVLDFPFLVADVVGMGRIPHVTGRARDHEIVEDVISALDLDALTHRVYTTLSGGERQRVQIARVLAQVWDRIEDSYLLFDEPTAPLDLAHQLGFLELVRDIAHRGAAGLLVLHDLNLAARYSDLVVLLKDGEIIAAGTPSFVMTKDNIGSAFGVEVEVSMFEGQPFIHAQRIRS